MINDQNPQLIGYRKEFRRYTTLQERSEIWALSLAGWSDSDIARKLGLHRSSVGRILKGKSAPKYGRLRNDQRREPRVRKVV